MSKPRMARGLFDRTSQGSENSMGGIVSTGVGTAIGYLIAGVCDEDCDDLDFFLYDTDERLITTDEEYGHAPMIGCDGGPAIEVILRVRMFSGQLEPCAFGVVAFREQ